MNIPPHSIEAECGILGSILTDPMIQLEKAISLKLLPEMFYDGRNSKLFEHLIEMDGKRLDSILIAETLKDIGVLDRIGGYEHLIELQNENLVLGHLESYATIVKEKYRARKAIQMASETIERIQSLENPDLCAQSLIEDLETLAPEKVETMAEVIQGAADEAQAIANGEMVFLPFPWKEFQKRTLGIPAGAVTPFLGRDKTGKSRLAMLIVKHWLEMDLPVLVFAFEDGKRRYLQALAATFGGYDTFTLRRHPSPNYMQNMRKWMEFLKTKPIYVIDDSMAAEEVAATIGAYKRKHGIRGVVIDGFKDIIASRGENRTGEENHIFETVKRAAKRHDVGVLQIEHTHDVEDGKWLSKRNIRGSKQRAQSARMFLIYQDCGFPEQIANKYRIYDESRMMVLDCQACSYGDTAIVPLRTNLEVGMFNEITADFEQ